MRSQQAMEAYIAGFQGYPYLIFFLVQLLSVVLAPIPSNLSAAAGGVLFGTWPAFFLTISAVLCGSTLMFCLTRRLGRPFADRFVNQRISEKYLDLIHSRTSTFLILAFLFPFFPDDLLCILAGLTSISTKRFVLIAVLTRPWGLLVACAIGGSTLQFPPWAMVVVGILGFLVFILGLKYGDRWERTVIQHLRRYSPRQR